MRSDNTPPCSPHDWGHLAELATALSPQNLWYCACASALVTPNIVELLQKPDATHLAAVLLSLSFLASLPQLLSMSPRMWLLVASPLALLSTVDTVHLLAYGQHLSPGGIDAIVATNPSEASEFGLFYADKIGLVFTISLLIAAFLFVTAPKERATAAAKASKVLIAFVIVFFIDSVARGSSSNAFPDSFLRSFWKYHREHVRERALCESRKNYSFGATRETQPSDEETYVLVIGESMRRDHLNLYGYGRNTTPHIGALPNLITFTDVTSPANLTINSLKLMLSPATAGNIDLFYSTKSIVSLAREIGFTTYWISNQGRIGPADTEVTVMADEANTTIFLNTGFDTSSLDSRVIEPLESVLKNRERKKFIVVHLLGSHLDYRKRFPDEFNLFHAPAAQYVNRDRKTIDLINNYDNSICYTDFILGEIVRSVKRLHTHACIIYTSDHAEYLSENDDRVGHGFEPPHKCEVETPLIVWYSKTFQQNSGEKVTAMKANHELPVTTEDLFFSLAGLLDADFSKYDARRNFFGSSYESPSSRLVYTPAGNTTDYGSLQ